MIIVYNLMKQIGIALNYLPVTGKVETIIPVFYTNLRYRNSKFDRQNNDTLLFFDYDDLMRCINELPSALEREAAINGIKVTSFVDLILKAKSDSDSSQLITKYPLKYVGFDGIRDVDFSQDEKFLRDMGIPCPPKFLNIELNPDSNWDFYSIVRTVMEQYQKSLVDMLEKCSNERFDKRKGMLIKLVEAVGLKWNNAYRWKASDRALIRCLDTESFVSTRKTQQQAKQNLQIYQILWQEHCQSMRQLLGEWNDAIEIMEKYKLQESVPSPQSQECGMASIINELNEIIQECFNNETEAALEPHTYTQIENLSNLLQDVKLDSKTANRIFDKETEISNLKKSKQNQQIFRGYCRKQYLSTLVPWIIFVKFRPYLKESPPQMCYKKQVAIHKIKMAPKFLIDDNLLQNLIKYSVQRNIKATLIQQFPNFKDVIDDILPKKGQIFLAKCEMVPGYHLYASCINVKFSLLASMIYPDPNAIQKMQVDKGAIKFILRGSNVMCPGLTSEGGRMDDVESGTVVQVLVDGREHACAVGITTMSTEEIRSKNQDVCIETMHYLNDTIWKHGIAINS
ncbi:bifunctional PUA domain/MCT-1-Tma20/Pre-PUA domain/Uncharacterized domain CHP00451/PUA-like superfamily [Babesia duncani]|uniref:Bifunctional PUA domain/MCT-1-Tma20/Pre-PUA domain/Uncharacterized domain CHP00451/PUA-like superfamily n=1 Tax=Babesia duncani TaxID=323732 RepID=A0AAD9UN82_9APIC|nr:bifunctional PUA domain/MCT-1-Tma20/Pre-PUA domain/Uncharacterized domain CHP00451/PUA-like superfamily [Babesia duncani]